MSDVKTVKDLIMALGANGKIFSVKFIRRSDQQESTLVARYGVKKGLKFFGPNYDSDSYGVFRVWDVQDNKFKSIPMESVIELRGRGKVYKL